MSTLCSESSVNPIVDSLENDILVFSLPINRTIVDNIEHNEPSVDAFLLQYLRIASIEWTDDQLSRLLTALRTRIDSTDKKSVLNALKCKTCLLFASLLSF